MYESAVDQSTSKSRKISKIPAEESNENIDYVDAKCKEVTESDCYFSSDPSNCNDWIVSSIRLDFKIRIFPEIIPPKNLTIR